MEEFLDFGIGEGLGEERVAQKCVEFSFAGKVLEGGVVDDDGARDGLAGVRIEDGFVGGLGLGSDKLREINAGWPGEGIEGVEPRRGQGGFDQ